MSESPSKLAFPAIAIGAVFALGLAISGMTHPVKVAGFLDVGGTWDPTLAFVMMGAVITHHLLLRVAKRRQRPILDVKWHLPDPSPIDWKLILGSILFGIGWGYTGYCPGPALVSVGRSSMGTIAFVIGMVAGIAATRFLLDLASKRRA